MNSKRCLSSTDYKIISIWSQTRCLISIRRCGNIYECISSISNLVESGTFEWCWICACLQSPQSFNWLQSNVPALGGGDWPIGELLQLFGSANVWICQPPCIYSAFNKKLKNLSVITPKRRMCRLLSLPTETFHALLFWSSFSSERKLYLPWKSCLALWLLFQLNTKKNQKNKKTQRIIGTDGQNM